MTQAAGDLGSYGVASAMEQLTTEPGNSMDVDEDKDKEKMSPKLQHQVKLIRPVLGCVSRLGRALTELFGLLVKVKIFKNSCFLCAIL